MLAQTLGCLLECMLARFFFLATCSPAPTHKPASMLGDGDHRRAAEATMAATPWLQGRLQKLSEILGCSATVLTHR